MRVIPLLQSTRRVQHGELGGIELVSLPPSSRLCIRLSLSYCAYSLDRFDNGLLQQLCLVYALAARAPFVAFFDLDDYPPAELSAVLDRIQRDRWAGARFFFDAAHSCPLGVCPCSERGWSHHCNNDLPYNRTPTTSLKEYANIAISGAARFRWKPLVVPHKTDDVSQHGFRPRGGAWHDGDGEGQSSLPSDIWCPCIHHGYASHSHRRSQG